MSITPASILVIDDEPDLCTLYELTLLRQGYRVETAASVAQALEQLARQGFDLVITDMRLPDGLGLQILQQLRQQQRPERCIVMTAYGSAENAVEALRAGAFDYLTKPVDLKQFRTVVASALADAQSSSSSGSNNNSAPTSASAPRTAPSAGANPANAANAASAAEPPAMQALVGSSPAMQQLKQQIAKVARSMAPVLIYGESGTGKELVARALHASSARASGPLVAVNCGAIPEALLEAEFFGARKGSYTGASQDRPGFFQAARGGSLFLDEIGELPLSMQSKLLRAIQERSVRPLGATQEEAVDVRILSATHRNLGQDVQDGRFRQDLYYRLNVIELAIAPLRQRLEDLPQLCQALLERIAQEAGQPAKPLSPAALAQLAQQALPGNVRELENLLHRAVALSDEQAALLDLPEPSNSPSSSATPTASVPSTVTAPQMHAWVAQHAQALWQAQLQTQPDRHSAAAAWGLTEQRLAYHLQLLALQRPAEANAQPD